MPRISFEIKTYEVFLARQLEHGGTKFYALIVCRSDAGHELALHFLTPDSPTPANTFDPQSHVANAYLPAEQYTWYLDLLRNERPVYAKVDSDNPLANRLTTSTAAGWGHQE